MRIGIDARLYKQTGVGRYIQNLISSLSEIDLRNHFIVYLNKKDYADFTPSNKRWEKKLLDVSWHSLEEQVKVPYAFMRDKLDVTHFPYFNVPLIYPKKYLLTIHDLIIDHFDTGQASTHSYFVYKLKRFAYKKSLAYGIKRAKAIVSISETTKQEIIEHYRVDPSKITVTYDAIDESFIRALEIRKSKKMFEQPYLLYVGNAYPHKNLERLLLAFKNIRLKKKVQLVLTGDDPFFYTRLKKFVYTQKISDVKFYGTADDNELINLYNHTSCLISPSLMEGFGLPNLEAVICGKIIAAADIPVYREIWKNNLIYFDPYDINDISEKIIQALNMSEKKYVRRNLDLRNCAKKFNWMKTAEKTLTLYEKIHRLPL